MDIRHMEATRSTSPIGQSKDGVELRISLVKDFQLSGEINFCGSAQGMSGGREFKSKAPPCNESAEQKLQVSELLCWRRFEADGTQLCECS